MPGITDWNRAYDNSRHVADSAEYPDRWAKAAADFRNTLGDRGRFNLSYGPNDRHRTDLFLPETSPRGLAIFVHGGYWRRFDQSYWSHMMAGALRRGWAVGVPTYTLCPEASIPTIVTEVARAIRFLASHVEGPIRLAGHSAGGHLVTRQLCGSVTGADIAHRIENVVSLSGVHDLRPLLKLALNDTLGLTEPQACGESPALLTPTIDVPVACWVGADELAEFVRQNALLASIWKGLGIETSCHEVPGRHHFSVVEDLADADNPLTKAWLD